MGTNPEWAAIFEQVQPLLKTAGGIALEYFRQPLTVENKAGESGFDPVTQADKAVEAYLREQIGQLYPAHSFMGEEQGLQENAGEYLWVVDPIDGTRAFMTGFPGWGILAGLRQQETIGLGIMHQPFLRETFVGIAGEAYLYKDELRQALSTRPEVRLNEASLYTTHPSMFDSDERAQELYGELLQKVRLGRYGGDCYAYCMLAMGQIDLVVEADLQFYDIIPLIPIVEGAGGVVTDWQGNSAASGGYVVAAANPELHAQALAILAG